MPNRKAALIRAGCFFRLLPGTAASSPRQIPGRLLLVASWQSLLKFALTAYIGESFEAHWGIG